MYDKKIYVFRKRTSENLHWSGTYEEFCDLVDNGPEDMWVNTTQNIVYLKEEDYEKYVSLYNTMLTCDWTPNQSKEEQERNQIIAIECQDSMKAMEYVIDEKTGEFIPLLAVKEYN